MSTSPDLYFLQLLRLYGPLLNVSYQLATHGTLIISDNDDNDNTDDTDDNDDNDDNDDTDDTDKVQDSLYCTQTQCYVTSNLLTYLFTPIKSRPKSSFIKLSPTLYYYSIPHLFSYRIDDIGALNIIDDIIDRFDRSGFMTINIESVPMFCGFHLLTLIRIHDIIYLIQSFSDKYSYIIDIYPNSSSILRDIAFMYDTLNPDLWRQIVHLEPNSDDCFTSPLIEFTIIDKITPSLSDLSSILYSALSVSQTSYPSISPDISSLINTLHL